jgi:hypothetical protein
MSANVSNDFNLKPQLAGKLFHLWFLLSKTTLKAYRMYLTTKTVLYCISIHGPARTSQTTQMKRENGFKFVTKWTEKENKPSSYPQSMTEWGVNHIF